MSERVRLNVSLTIHDGKLEAFQAIAREMVETTRNESGALAYEWYFSGDGKRCRVIETYVNAHALEAHVAGSAVQQGLSKLLTISDMNSLECYGVPGPNAEEKLGRVGAKIFSHWNGLV